MDTGELSAALWHERKAVEWLVFKLEEARLLLAAGRHLWLVHAAAEVKQASERARLVSLARGVAVSSLADGGLDADASLRAIAANAPSAVWASIFEGHRLALASLVAQAAAIRDENQCSLRAACVLQEAELGVREAEGTHASTSTVDSTLRHRDYLAALQITSEAIPAVLLEYLA